MPASTATLKIPYVLAADKVADYPATAKTSAELIDSLILADRASITATTTLATTANTTANTAKTGVTTAQSRADAAYELAFSGGRVVDAGEVTITGSIAAGAKPTYTVATTVVPYNNHVIIPTIYASGGLPLLAVVVARHMANKQFTIQVFNLGTAATVASDVRVSWVMARIGA